MFLSVGEDIKFHSVCNNGELENFIIDYRASKNNIIGVSISNDNTYLALLREGEDPQILHTRSKFGPRLIHTIPVKNVTALVFKRTTKRYLALGTEDGTILTYDVEDKTATQIHQSLGDTIQSLDYTSDDGHLCGIARDMLFYFTGENGIQKFRQTSECTYLRCHHKKPDQAALGLRDGSVIVWKLTLGEPLVKLDLFSSPVSGIAVFPCGNFLAAAADKMKICRVGIRGSHCNLQFTIPQEFPVTAMDARYDTKCLVLGLKDGTVKLYDMQALSEPVYTKKLHDGPVRKILFENKTEESRSYATTASATVLERSPVPTTSSDADIAKDEEDGEEEVEQLTKLRERLFDFFKTELDRFEAKLEKHCSELEEFMNDEFANIDSLMKSTFENQDEIVRKFFGKGKKKSEPKNL